MPALKPLTQQGQVKYNTEKLVKELDHNLHDNRITYSQIAKLLGLTPAAISAQFKQRHISIDTWVAAQMLLGEKK